MVAVAVAALGVLLLVAGLLLQALAGSSLGAAMAIVGLLVAMSTQVWTHVWAKRHEDRFR